MGRHLGRRRLNLLLDTHALLWFATDPNRFAPRTLAAIYDAEVVRVSVVSAYELMFKQALGKLPAGRELLADIEGYCEQQGFDILPITLAHAGMAGRLALDHRDPFDRMLTAQALIEALVIVSTDDKLDIFGVRRLW